jgi:Mn2+/Fe2+ NRAMP family transporter
MGINFIGIDPMKALTWAGIVQGLSAPPLLFLIMLMTNNRAIMGSKLTAALSTYWEGSLPSRFLQPR